MLYALWWLSNWRNQIWVRCVLYSAGSFPCFVWLQHNITYLGLGKIIFAYTKRRLTRIQCNSSQANKTLTAHLLPQQSSTAASRPPPQDARSAAKQIIIAVADYWINGVSKWEWVSYMFNMLAGNDVSEVYAG